MLFGLDTFFVILFSKSWPLPSVITVIWSVSSHQSAQFLRAAAHVGPRTVSLCCAAAKKKKFQTKNLMEICSKNMFHNHLPRWKIEKKDSK